MLYYRLFDCPKVNFGPLSTFAPWKGWSGSPIKNGVSVKNLFGAILGPKMMAFLNTRCNISIRASVHLCKFVSSSQVYQKYSRSLFYIYRKASWKMLLASEVIFHGLASISIDSSFFVTWLHFQWLLYIYLAGPCNFVNVIYNGAKLKFKRIK